MIDEEKKAIEILKDREYDFDELYCTFRQSFIKPYDESIDIILNLIEKQSKEIEELNWKIQEQRDLLKYKSDKIEKQSKEIEELKEKNKTLKSLQNDTNGLYIEMTERKNYFERELQKVVDKIKAKIEELEKLDFGTDLVSQSTANLTTIIILQSLLEKE